MDITGIAKDMLVPVSGDVIDSCSIPLPYPINKKSSYRYNSHKLSEPESAGIAPFFRNVLAPCFEKHAKERAEISKLENDNPDPFASHEYKMRLDNDFSAMWMSYYIPLDWYEQDIDSMCAKASNEAYAVATSPDMVYMAEELGICSTRKAGYGNLTSPMSILLSPGYLEGNKEAHDAEVELSRRCCKMFDERDHPEMFEVVGYDDVGRARIALKNHVPTIGVCAQEIVSAIRTSLSSTNFDAAAAFAEANEGWGAGLQSATFPMLALPSDPLEVKDYIRNLTAKDEFSNVKVSLPCSPCTPKIVLMLLERACVLPAICAHIAIRRISAAKNIPEVQATMRFGEMLARDAQDVQDTVGAQQLIDEYVSFYEEEDISSYLDALASGVPMEDVLA